MLDERLERVRRELDEPPWDELRETRVLGRVLEEASQSSRRRVTHVAIGATSFIAAAAGLLLLRAPEPKPAPPAPIAAAVLAPTAAVQEPAELPAPVGSVLTLADGSRAELSPDAAVQTLEQSETRVSVRQSRGRVRYDVTRRPEREFLVHAGDVEVRVLGTVFAIELSGDGVEVSVERGRVAVSDRKRKVELARGESMFLAEGDEIAAPEVQDAAPAPRTSRRVKEQAPPTADALLARADSARQLGRLTQAAQALSLLVKHHADDPRAVSAWFTLGRVERARGRHAASASAFERCFERSPNGTLAEDALAESARGWASAGQDGKARSAARQSLARFPGGTHATRMRELAAADSE